MGHDEIKISQRMRLPFLSKFFRHPEVAKGVHHIPEVHQPPGSESRLSSYEKLKRQGIELLNEGNAKDAERAFSAALQENPVAESHLNLGFALLELRRADEAKIQFDQAALLGPTNFDAHLLRAMVAIFQSDHDAALAAIQVAVELNSDSVLATGILYKLFAIRGEFEKITDRVKRLVKPDTDPAQIHVEVANILVGIPDDGELRKTLLAKANQHLDTAFELDSSNPHAHTIKGRIFLTSNELESAVESFKRAIQMASDFAPAHLGLARCYKARGQFDLSFASAKNAVLADPALIDAYKLLAELSSEKCAYADAVKYYKKILAIEPDAPDALIMLGVVYSDLRLFQLALDTTRQAVNLRRNSPEVHFALGNIFSVQNLFSNAVECYRHALTLNPDYQDARNNLASKLLAMGQADESLALYQQIARADPAHIVALQNIAFSLSCKADCTSEEYLAAARQFGKLASLKAKPYTIWRQLPMTGRALKVGLVSGDLRRHPVGLFLESVLTYFDIEKIEIHAFSNMASVDDLQASLKSRVSHWTSIAGLSDEVAARLIHEAGLDLLIDLSGHTGAGRLAVFAWRPAPVQATWLGFWGSTGVEEIDYILTDRQSVLPVHHHHFSEQVWYMADTRLCFTPPSFVYTAMSAPCPMLKRGHVTFGCFQSIRKLNKEVLALWGRIYQQLPHAHFRLQGAGFNDAKIRGELLERLAAVGIPAARVSLHNHEPGFQYLKSHAEVDIILDSFPYPGGTTTCDALWMGVPTVTLAGNTMLSRQGLSLLTYAGLSDWVAQTQSEYVSIAVAKASDPAYLSRLRAGLRQQVFESPLFNAPRFAGSLECTLLEMVLHKKPWLAPSQ